jgi:competence protein ComEC
MSRVLLVVLLAALASAGRPLADQGTDLLRVHFVDVGQGDAIWIQGPERDGEPARNVIIDGGPDTGTGDRLLTYLDKYHLPKGSLVDYVIATHPHEDHYPGLLDILKNYEVKTIVDSGYPKEGTRFAQFVAAARAETVKGKKSDFVRLRERPDFKLDLGDELQARILYTDTANAQGLGSGNTRENNASTVIRLVYKNFSFLFVGDAEGKERSAPATEPHFVEKILLDRLGPQGLRSTVLKAGHHGSESGSTLPFIQAVQPDVVVVMSGRKPFNGTFIPDATVLARYKAARPDVTVVRTDEGDAQQGLTSMSDADGDDILIFTDGDSLQVSQSRGPLGHRKWVKLRTIQK